TQRAVPDPAHRAGPGRGDRHRRGAVVRGHLRHRRARLRPMVSALLGPADIRQLAERLGVRPTKTLGQNFVHDPNTVRRIVRAADLADDDVVVEVGPGLGSLTLGLLPAVAHVHAVEIDEVLAAELPATALAPAPEGAGRLCVYAPRSSNLRPADS